MNTMRLPVKIFAAICTAGVVVIVGHLAGWWGTSNSPADGAPAATVIDMPTVESGAPPPFGRKSPTPRTKARATAQRDVPSPAPVATTVPAPTGTPAGEALAKVDWENRLDQVLTATIDDGVKALQFIAMMPELPEDAQVEAVSHAVNLLPNNQYAALSTILANPQTPEPVVDVLLTDLLDRPNQIKLPLLLQVARTPNHPGHEDALEDLSFYLDADYGTDWNQWDKSVAAYLRDNPE